MKLKIENLLVCIVIFLHVLKTISALISTRNFYVYLQFNHGSVFQLLTALSSILLINALPSLVIIAIILIRRNLGLKLNFGLWLIWSLLYAYGLFIHPTRSETIGEILSFAQLLLAGLALYVTKIKQQ